MRQTKLAFVDGHAKPPRSVRKQQERFGTAGSVHKKLDPLSKLSSHGGPGSDPAAEAGALTLDVSTYAYNYVVIVLTHPVFSVLGSHVDAIKSRMAQPLFKENGRRKRE